MPALSSKDDFFQVLQITLRKKVEKMKPRVFATQTAVNQGKIQPVKYYFVIFLFK